MKQLNVGSICRPLVDYLTQDQTSRGCAGISRYTPMRRSAARQVPGLTLMGGNAKGSLTPDRLEQRRFTVPFGFNTLEPLRFRTCSAASRTPGRLNSTTVGPEKPNEPSMRMISPSNVSKSTD